MNYQTSRKLAKYGHIAIAIFQLAYIYTPLHDLPYSLVVVQFISTPLLIISGIWLTKGQKIWKWWQGSAINAKTFRFLDAGYAWGIPANSAFTLPFRRTGKSGSSMRTG